MLFHAKLLIFLFFVLSFIKAYPFIRSFKTRVSLYNNLVSIDYKYVDIPSQLDKALLSVTFIGWTNTIPICPIIGNFTYKFQHGTFPLFEYDTIHGLNNDPQNEIIEGVVNGLDNTSRIVEIQRPLKPGKWIFGSVLHLNLSSDSIFARFCQVYLKITIMGNIKPVDKFLLLPQINEKVSLQLKSQKDFLIKLLTISNLISNSTITISNNSTISLIITFTSDGSIPPLITFTEAIKQKLVIGPNKTFLILSPPIISIEMKVIFIRVQSSFEQDYKISINNFHNVEDKTPKFVLQPVLNKEYLDSYFNFRYFENASDNIKVNQSTDSFIFPFQIEPIKDQGGILNVEGVGIRKSSELCVGDVNYIRSILLSSWKTVGYGGCALKLKSGAFSFKTPYPKAGWLYVYLQSNYEQVILNVYSSRSCLNKCSNNGKCSIIFFDVGLLYTCQCYQRSWSSKVIRPLRKGLDCSHIIPIDQYEVKEKIRSWWSTRTRRIILITTNLTIIIAGLYAIYQNFYLLGLVYMICGIASCFHHSYARTGSFDTDYYPIVHNNSYIKQVVFSSYPTNSLIQKFSVLDHVAAVVTLWALCMELSSFKRYPVIEILNYCGLIAIVIAGNFAESKNIWFIVVPLTVGVVIMLFSWVRTSIRLKLFFPPIDWCLTSFIPGILISIVAFVMMRLSGIYEHHYYIYHSIWHALIGVALLVFLPQRKIWLHFIEQSNNGHSTRRIDSEMVGESIVMNRYRNPPHVMKSTFTEDNDDVNFESLNCFVRKWKAVTKCCLSHRILKYFSQYKLFQYDRQMLADNTDT